MKLDSKNAEPLYLQLVRSIQADISSGKYPNGSRLPSEAQFSEIYHVSRITVRAALKALAEQGAITRLQGKGTFVLQQKLKRNLSLATSFTQACREIGKTPGAKLVDAGIKPASLVDQQVLNLRDGDNIVYLQRVRYADDIPVSVEEDRFPMRYAFLLNEDLNDSSLLTVLKEKYNISFTMEHRTIELVYAPEHIAELLGRPSKSPMLFIDSSGREELQEVLGQRSLQYILGESFKLYI